MRRIVLGLVLLAGCAQSAEETPKVGEVTSPIVLNTPRALASFPDGFEMVGVTGDQRLLFVGQIASASTTPAVLAATRLSGRPVGALPPPPGGWGFPAVVLVTDYHTSGLATAGTLLVADNATFPPFSHTTIYRYSYSFGPLAGFSATLLDTHALPVQTFPPVAGIDGVGYTGDIAVLPSGEYVLADALDGAVWVCDASFACHLGDADPDFAPGAAPPAFVGVGRDHGGGTRPYTLTLTGGLLPGLLNVAYAASTDEVCGARTAQPGGIWCIDRATLLDTTVPPFGKPKRVLVAPQIGLTDGGHGVAYDKWNPTSPWLYWVRSPSDVIGGGSNIIRRVHLATGEVQEVARSLTVLDFSTGLAVLPPLVAGSPLTNLAVAMGQEENNAALNPVLGGVDDFVAPNIIAGVTSLSY